MCLGYAPLTQNRAAKRAFSLGAIACALALLPVSAGAQAPASEPAYVKRGHKTEVRQQELKGRLDHLHDALADQLRRHAPDLLPKIEPPPPIVYGYEILPRILADAPPAPHGKPHVVTFSWPASDSQIAAATSRIAQLESELADVPAQPKRHRRAAYEAVVAGYRKALDQRRIIDSDVAYNWLWQRQIFAGRLFFDRLNARLAEVNAQLAAADSAAASFGATLGVDALEYARISDSMDSAGVHQHVVTVPLVTDIGDAELVDAFRHAVESYWHVREGENEYRVRLTIATISPQELYCSAVAKPAEPADPSGLADRQRPPNSCAPPPRGTHIDLGAHVARFPNEVAVLTTGAESLQVVGVRAVVLDAHDQLPRTLAHEFGHILGFPDAYLRGYTDLGADGFGVLELVPDFDDIMSSPGSGSVLPRHFTMLFEAMRVGTLMRAGLDQLYQRHDGNAAAASFRRVLAINPEHYGATLQLAKALDVAGKPDEALPLWQKMLKMAEAAGDMETLSAVRSRLANSP